MERRPFAIPQPNGLAGRLNRALPGRLIAALALYGLVSVTVFGGIAAYVMEQRLSERDARETELLLELEQREISRHALESTLRELRYDLDERERHLAAIEREHAQLDRAFQRVDAERAALEDERDLARERARLLDRGVRETERWLETAQRERRAMARERTMLESRLTEVDAARAAAHRREQGLRWRLETTTERLARLEADRAATARWLADWLGGRLGAIEAVLQRTGIEPERLLARAADHGPTNIAQHVETSSRTASRPGSNGTETGGIEAGGTGASGTGTDIGASAWTASGLGGPLLPLAEPAGGPAILGLATPLVADLADEIDRLEAARRLLAAVPLATPLDHYHLTSGFGARTDPITGRRALHNGLDFGAPQGSEILATAPGRVTRAGRAGSYGIMVELDHGHGITTRYAHLSRTLVEVGDVVGLRAPIATIGNTGRSTGRHLHYEVRLDGQPRDPSHFIAAGRQLIEALGSREPVRDVF